MAFTKTRTCEIDNIDQTVDDILRDTLSCHYESAKKGSPAKLINVSVATLTTRSFSTRALVTCLFDGYCHGSEGAK